MSAYECRLPFIKICIVRPGENAISVRSSPRRAAIVCSNTARPPGVTTTSIPAGTSPSARSASAVFTQIWCHPPPGGAAETKVTGPAGYARGATLIVVPAVRPRRPCVAAAPRAARRPARPPCRGDMPASRPAQRERHRIVDFLRGRPGLHRDAGVPDRIFLERRFHGDDNQLPDLLGQRALNGRGSPEAVESLHRAREVALEHADAVRGAAVHFGLEICVDLPVGRLPPCHGPPPPS